MAIFTAAGADPESKPGIGGTAAGFGLYNQVKGTVEQDIKQLEFPTGSVVRPAGRKLLQSHFADVFTHNSLPALPRLAAFRLSSYLAIHPADQSLLELTSSQRC